jgi:hypothetical protein
MLIGLLLGTATAMLLPAGSALAGQVVQADGGFRYLLNDYELAPGTTKTFGAACPGRTSVVSGGITSFAEIGDSFISSTYPFDGRDSGSRPDDGWRSKLTAFDSYVDGNAYAVCGRLTPSYRKSRFDAPPNNDIYGEAVPCPNGEAVVHGGLEGPTSVRPASSHPFDAPGGFPDTWVVRPHNVSDRERRVTGHAVCSDELQVTYVSASATVGTNSRIFLEPQCPGSAPNVVGGGPVGSGGFGDIRLSMNAPDFFAQPLSDEWIVQIENEGAPANYTVWADCVPDL